MLRGELGAEVDEGVASLREQHGLQRDARRNRRDHWRLDRFDQRVDQQARLFRGLIRVAHLTIDRGELDAVLRDVEERRSNLARVLGTASRISGRSGNDRGLRCWGRRWRAGPAWQTAEPC